MIINLDKKDLIYCQEMAEKRSKKNHKDWQKNDYRRGLLNSKKDFCATERRGLYGELAFSKFINIPINEDILDNGDQGFDFSIKEIKIDVKFQLEKANWAVQKLNYYGPLYISAENQYGKERVYKSNIFFFTILYKSYLNNKIIKLEDIKRESMDLLADRMEIELLGYIKTKNILENKGERKNSILKKSNGNGNSTNYYIKVEELISPESFLRSLKKYLTR